MKDINLFCFICNLAVTVLIGILMPIVPALTRKSFLFGVKIPQKERSSPQAKALVRRYILVCELGFVILLALIVAQYLIIPEKTLVGIMYFPLLSIPVQMLAYIPCWKETLRLKRELGWQVDAASYAETSTSYTRGTLRALPWGWYILAFTAILAGAIAALIQYPSLPDMIPTHFDMNMNPDAWSAKSYGTVFAMPLINLAMLALMWAVGISLVKAKLQIDPQKPALSFAQHRAYRKLMGHAFGFLTLAMAVMMAMLGLASAFPSFKAPMWAVTLLISLPVVFLLAVSVRAGQGGCKLNPKVVDDSATEPGSTGMRAAADDDDKYWVLGSFYYNREDPSIVVADRWGTNIGFNYARPVVKAVAILSGVLFVACYVWLTVLLWNIG